MAEEIKCPKCGYEFEISEVLTSQIRENLREELERDIREKESSIEKLQLELKKREKEIEQEKTKIDDQVKEKLEKELEKIKGKAEKEATEKLNIELEDLRSQIAEKDKKISEANKAELELRKKTRAIEAKKEELELQVARKLDEERQKIKEEAYKKFSEEHHLKDLEKDKVIQDLKKDLENAKRKAEQGSMQTQGEVLELDLESALKTYFSFDEIEPVPKGIRGADVIQKVFNSAHKQCGVILWETKATKSWSGNWIQKLKDDQRDLGADIAVIVTQAMPKEIENFGLLNGIWVTSFNSLIGLATAIRQNLIEVNFAKLASVGKNEKMEAIYQYLSGPEFKQKVEAIVETFTMMQTQLDKEKRAINKIWNEREKQIQRITTNTVAMYGDVRGIIGASLPEIQSLELTSFEKVKELPEANTEDI